MEAIEANTAAGKGKTPERQASGRPKHKSKESRSITVRNAPTEDSSPHRTSATDGNTELLKNVVSNSEVASPAGLEKTDDGQAPVETTTTKQSEGANPPIMEARPGCNEDEHNSEAGHSLQQVTSCDNLNDNDDDEDGDPIPSGTGIVSRDCTASELVGWSEILPKWHAKLSQRPKGLDVLVRAGVPEPLRGEVWQLLAGAEQCFDLMEQYRIFLIKSSPAEQIILRDVHRTYPAHENFRSGGSGSSSLLDSLFKVCKAYAVYDEEVGYCQGLSFLVAALLLHMPEEQAFCVFVRIMKHYGLRDLFRNNFDELYLKFYQLERLLEDHMPDLYQHFVLVGIEPFTYASQWFLTVFTAKFPLNAVFYIMDIFLLDGMNTIFQIALALLSSSKQELLGLDFEGILKYFRVQMPKRYRNQENVQQLIQVSSEVSLKKLKKHAKQYEIIKQKEKLLENPLTRLQRENAKLTENNLRLEQENDDLARDLVASKIQLRAQIDLLEDKLETLNRALTYSRQDCQTYLTTISDIEDEKGRLEVEVCQLKEVCRRELNRAESELARDSSIIADYKKITSQLSRRLDKQVEIVEKFIIFTLESLSDNKLCKDKSCHRLFQVKSEDLLDRLKNIDSNFATEATIENETEDSNQKSPTIPTSSKNLDGEPSPRNRRVSAESKISNRPVGAYIKSEIDSPTSSSASKIEQLTRHVDELEIELARTKLALVEAECKCQQLTHDLNLGTTLRTSGSEGGSGSSSLVGRLDSLKAAVASSTKRSPRPTGASGGSSTFAKINNLISDKILATTIPSPGYNHQTMITQPVITLANDQRVEASASSPQPANQLTISGSGDRTIVSQQHDSNISANMVATKKSPLRLPISAPSIDHNNGNRTMAQPTIEASGCENRC